MHSGTNPHRSRSASTSSGVSLSWDDLWKESSVAEAFGSSWAPLAAYLRITEQTESPRHYHLWALLFLTASVASNHTWIDHGVIGKVRLNMGVVFAGRAAIRKSSALAFVRRFGQTLGLNIGPNDTGGARYGIMAAMQARWQNESKDEEDELQSSMPESLEELARSEYDSILPRITSPSQRSSSIVFLASELGRILTSQTRELLDFFADGLDGEPIFYQTKHGSIRIPAPLINILGATTPDNLATILPRDSHNHGMLSRIIFVYAGKSEKPVPIPPELTQQQINLQDELIQRLRRIQTDGIGVLTLSPAAREEYIRLYSHAVPTIEFRLNAYSGRRAGHLLRLAGVICLLRGESPYVISGEDIGLAHLILLLTEQDMDGAYAAMSKSVESRAYLIIRELIESSDGEISDMPSIQATLMRSGLDDKEITTALERILRSGRARMSIDKLILETGLGGIKARNYLNRWLSHSAKAP